MPDREIVVNDLNVSKLMLCNPKMLTSEMYVRIGQAINGAIDLLKKQEAVEPKVSSTEQRCGNCNKVIEMDGWIACPWCGKPIAWNEWWNKNGVREVKRE